MSPIQTKSWQKLNALFEQQQKVHLKTRFENEENRFSKFSIETPELVLDFSKNHVNKEVLDTLIEFSKEMNLPSIKENFFKGDKINKTENRAVLHTALRDFTSDKILVDGENVLPKVKGILTQIEKFSDKVIGGKHLGFTGKPITDIVNIGIGGSDLGPKMVVQSMGDYSNHLTTHFVSNVDYAAINKVLKSVNIETTLFVIVSKTFTTIETIINANTARKAVLDYFGSEKAIANHFVAVSTNLEETNQFGIDKENVFEFWDWVGGRYSLWSAVGLSISLALGYSNFELLLKGAHQADLHFKNQPEEKNIPLIMALIGIWNINFQNYNSQAVIPYADDLGSFPKFLQQLDMESNGKSVDKDGNEVDYNTATVIWGEAGTDCQHSFFQLLHQGTNVMPVDFIGISKPKEELNKHDEILFSNLIGQSQALMNGTYGEELEDSEIGIHKKFDGNRPSNTIVMKGLTPHNLGYLTATYEHKVFVQGVLWNIFSFDQWGVQLGKKIATQLGDATQNELNKMDDSSKELYKMLM